VTIISKSASLSPVCAYSCCCSYFAPCWYHRLSGALVRVVWLLFLWPLFRLWKFNSLSYFLFLSNLDILFVLKF
jgi:hypothetical protein